MKNTRTTIFMRLFPITAAIGLLGMALNLNNDRAWAISFMVALGSIVIGAYFISLIKESTLNIHVMEVARKSTNSLIVISALGLTISIIRVVF